MSATVAAWPLDMAAKYVGQFLLPALNGQLDAQLGVNWQAATADKPQALQITAPQLALSEVQLAQGKTSLVSVKKVALSGVDIDEAGQSFQAARMQSIQPSARAERGADQRWMYERWLVRQASASPPAAMSKTQTKTSNSAPTWAVAINDVQLDGGAVSFSDKAGVKPVAFEVTAARAQLGGLVLDARPAARTQAAKLMPLSASLRLATGRLEPGQLDFKGSLGLVPLQAKGQVAARRLPVQAFEPYFGGALNSQLLRADASFKGRVAYRQTAAGPQAEVAGDAAFESFKANTLAPSEELLPWKTLNVRGLAVALDPAKATRVDVKETVLSDFFARVIVSPEGRINLQDLLKPPAAAGTTVADAFSTRKEAAESMAASWAHGPAAHREFRPHQPAQWPGPVFRPLCQTQLFGRPERADGRLTASNKLVLNQLSFGDKVALLAAHNGVIDLDQPISGSLNDPQFRLGPVIVKVILNVIIKAITVPFSLLAHALDGGKEEMSVFSPADYAALLKEIYKRAEVPKPRNLIGLTRDQPVSEMEKLLLADLPVSDDAMHALAVQRGVAVRDYLVSHELPADRLFLGAVKAVPPEAKWTPRAELNLAMP
ncbi:MAG: DUF748 domain-containing protein [Polaromonas sp.]